MKISLRLFLTIGLLTVFVCGALTVGFLLHSTNSSNEAVEKLAESVESAAAAQKIQESFAAHRRQSLINIDQTEVARLVLLQSAEELTKFSSSPDEDLIIKKVQQNISSYLKNFDTMKANGSNNQHIRETGSREYYETLEAIQELTKFNLDEAKFLQKETDQKNHINRLLTAIAFALFSILFASLLLGLRKFFYKPIVKLQNTIEGFELGGSTKQMESVGGASEIQSIAASFKKLSYKLLKQKDMQYTFLSSIAHDLKNPLGAIKMSAELISDDKGLSPQSHEMLGIIARQTDHLTRLINDLLDTARFESGHMEYRFKPCDIRKIIQDSAILHSSLSKVHQIDLQLPQTPIFVLCDEQRMTQVLNNLLNNAIKYSPEGGKIVVKAIPERKHVTIHVSDSGVGILQEDLEKIFEPYHRSKITRDSIPGVGLGLSVSKKILQAHEDGKIFVSSEAGKGTTFTISLKLIPELDENNSLEFL